MAKKNSNSGRKTTNISEIEAMLEEWFRIDATESQACLHACCFESAYYRKLDGDERFRKRMKAAQNFLPMRAMQAIAWNIGKKRNSNCAIWLLELREEVVR